MYERKSWRRTGFMAGLLVLLMFGPNAYATNGYFSHGYGLKYQALAGAGVALSLSSFASTLNPGAMVFVGRSHDIALDLFNPNRQYTITGNPSQAPGTFGLTPGTVKSGSKVFAIPAIGLNWMLNDITSFGISIYGNGGMNTNYDTATFYGSSPTGVDLAQLFLAPTFAIKVSGKHGFGIMPIIAYQRFQAEGLQAFGNFSEDPAHLTNMGHDNSFGFGARVGYLGELLDFVSVGASYQTKVSMSKLGDYAGLFAQQGSFDIPANWTLGVALGPPAVELVFDVQRIYYSDVNSIGNPMLPNLMTAPLGADNAAGFGWRDMTVYKWGMQYQTSNDWTLRAGYSISDQPIPDGELLFNILAPGVIERHLTFGFTKTLGLDRDVTFVVMRAFSKDIQGFNSMEVPGQQTIDLKMNQWEFGFGFSF